MKEQKTFYLVGPTGVGKSDIAVLAAQKIHAEIVSADSMQVYKGMDIITAKPGPDLLALVPHHLIDVVECSESFDVARYIEMVTEKISEISERGKTALVVGGTGMYIKALIDGLFSGPGKDEILRNKLTHELEEIGPEKMHEKLEKIDVRAAEKIHPQNSRRVIRALEVYFLTGQPISSFQNEWEEKKDACMIGIRRKREELYKRIEDRVELMIEAGLIDEVRNLIRQGIIHNSEAMQAIGIKEIISFLNKEISLDEAIRLMKRNSRRYAKRQMSWFNADDRIKWIDLTPDDTAETGAQKVLKELGNLKLET